MAYGDRTQADQASRRGSKNGCPATGTAACSCLLALTFIVMAAGPPDGWTRIITVLLQGLTLLAALLASRVSRRLFRLARIVAAGVVARRDRLGRGRATRRNPSGVFFLLNMLLVATVPVVIARALWRRQVDRRAHRARRGVHLRAARDDVRVRLRRDRRASSSGPFFVQTAHATTPDFLYFSFITQTTVGYGDFTAAGDLGRALAVVEALTGQLYLVTIIAVLVSRLSGATGSRARIRADADDGPAPRRHGTGLTSVIASSGSATRLQQVALVEVVEQAERRQDHDRGDDEHDRHRPQRRRRAPRRRRASCSSAGCTGTGRRPSPSDDGGHRAHGEHAGTGVASRATGARASRARRAPTGSRAGAPVT